LLIDDLLEPLAKKNREIQDSLSSDRQPEVEKDPPAVPESKGWHLSFAISLID
jgi:hypothetical protein